MVYSHIPVLIQEVLDVLNPRPNENLFDGTLGGAGHSAVIMEYTGPRGKLLGVDMDEAAIAAAKVKLQKFDKRIILKRDSFVNLVRLKKESDLKIHLLLLDLGISSKQLDDESLGISFLKNAPLDMRLGGSDLSGGKTAETVVNAYPEVRLFEILRDFGEERYAKLIAAEIVKTRQERPLSSTTQLVETIGRAVPEKYKHERIHFATRTFQALRIEVNRELSNLREMLPQALEVLEPGGRMAIISFHSLEDRIVKQFFNRESKDCVCAPEVPVCVCKHQKRLEILTKKPVRPTEEELKRNPRARSARLRAAQVLLK